MGKNRRIRSTLLKMIRITVGMTLRSMRKAKIRGIKVLGRRSFQLVL